MSESLVEIFIEAQKKYGSAVMGAASSKLKKINAHMHITEEGMKNFNARIEAGISTNDNARSSLTQFASTHYLGR